VSSEDIFILVVIVLSVALPLLAMLYVFRRLGGVTGGIKNGLPAQAVIQSLAETGVTISTPSVGPEAPVYKIGLLVTPPGGGTPYPAESKHAIPRLFVPMMLPGATIGVLVDPADPAHIVPDWSRISSPAPGMAGAGMAGEAPGQALMDVAGVPVAFDAAGVPAAAGIAALVNGVRSGAVPQEKGSAARLLATGTHGTGVITTAQPLGKTVRDLDPSAPPDRLGDPLWLFTLEVSLPGQAAFPAMFGHRVPLAKVASVAPGVKLAVAVDEADRYNEVAIDWDRSPIS
jgi:hypothetical protein